jgi:undecaprenyl phosphate-alpha-L-ara4N flippase subunit ArnE
MSESLTMSALALIAFCIITEAAREVCFKQAAHNVGFAAALAKPVTWLGIVFWGVELVAWTIVLEHVALSIAFPLMALVYVAVVAAGAWIFKEQVNLRHGIGALLITAGVACVGATGI